VNGVAIYDMEPFAGGDRDALAAYINRMNDELRFVLSHLDNENMTDEYEQRRSKEAEH